jgi:hypothetical protein
MTSTTTRYPVKTKTLTLLELCQTINDLRYTSSTSTAQILTRRLYLHPLTISSNAKQHTSKLIANNLLEFEQLNQPNFQKKTVPSKHGESYRGLQILSSSFPLTTRTNTKLSTSITTDNDSSNLNEPSTATISTNQSSLPPISRVTSSSSKHTISTRSSYISHHQRTNFNYIHRPEKVDVWNQLARTLQRPMPKDPPTTPFDTSSSSDYHLQNIQETDQEQEQTNNNSIQEIKIYKRNPIYNSFINENVHNE